MASVFNKSQKNTFKNLFGDGQGLLQQSTLNNPTAFSDRASSVFSSSKRSVSSPISYSSSSGKKLDSGIDIYEGIATPLVNQQIPYAIGKSEADNTAVNPPVTNNISTNNLTGSSRGIDEAIFAYSDTASKDLGMTADRYAVSQPTARGKGLEDILGLIQQQGEQGARQAELEETYGFDEAALNVANLNAQYATTKRRLEKEIRDIQEEGFNTPAQLQAKTQAATVRANRELADIAVQQQAAQGNLVAVNDLINRKISAEFEPIKNQIEGFKTYFALYNDDLSSSEKIALESAIRQQENAYETQANQALNQEKASTYQQMLNQGTIQPKDIPADVLPYMDSVTVSKWTSEMVDPLISKSNEIDSIIDNIGSANAVGPNPLARMNLTENFTAEKSNFIADVQRLVSKETLDTLIELKRAGGTLGALSDQERIMLQNAASNIGSWAIEKDGRVVGYDTTEKEFQNELRRIQGTVNNALLRADIIPIEKKAEILTKRISRENPTMLLQDVKEAVKEILPTYISDFSSAGNASASNRPQRNNNPLNIKASEFTQSFKGVSGVDPIPATDGGKFLVFNSPQAGLEAAKRLITSQNYQSLTVDNALERWSNSGYGGEIAPSIASKKISSLSKQELDSLIQAMARREGFYS